jgi:hypothetical protein
MIRTRPFETFVALACAGQAALLARLAGADSGLAAGVFALVAVASLAVAPALLRRWPEATAMLAIGGFGMTLGWWADLGFRSAAELAPHTPAALDPLWCWSPGSAYAALPLGHLWSWMNAGMLAFGLPATARAHGQRRESASAIAALACALAMIAGMTAGSVLAARLVASFPAPLAVLGDWLGMSAGMLAAMAAVRAPAAFRGRQRATIPTSLVG